MPINSLADIERRLRRLEMERDQNAHKLSSTNRDVNKVLPPAPVVFGRPVFLSTRLTSTAWDGDARSTTAKTLIDLSAVFGVPAGVKAVLAGVSMRDSGSAASTGGCYLILSPVNTNLVGVYTYCAGLTNDAYAHHNIIVPCDANGDIYYQINASGSGTMDVYLEIWGYWL